MSLFVLDLLGAVLTLITLLFLGLGGYLLARLLLRERAETDPLALAVASLLAATAEAGAIGLVLGLLGVLKIAFGLAILAALTLLLLRAARATRDSNTDPWAPARLLGRRVRDRIRESPVLALIAVHAAASEALRGLLRPPLSWDSLMYHLMITGTWLQTGRIAPVFGAQPMNFYGYQPAGGSVWMWWWMAPSHSELYVNLAFFPQALLLALAVGGVARELGARRHWPLASFLALLAPVVIRFAATQYVDIFVGAGIAAATFFMLLWMDEPRWGPAALAGAGLGLAAGSKVLGLTYALTLAPVSLLVARGEWRRRVPQIAAALLVCAVLGSPFYLQNLRAGAGPLGARCDTVPAAEKTKDLPTIPRVNTVAYLFPEMVRNGQLVDAFLGVTYPGSLELGLGPQVFLLLPVFLLPLGVPRADRRGRRGAFLVWSQIAAQVFIWVTVPFASSGHVFANVRYLAGGLGLCFAGVVALAERRGMSDVWLRGVALALAVQDLLMLHAEMPRGVRLLLAAVDSAAVALAFSPALRAFAVRRRRELAAAAAVAAVLAAPSLSRFRLEDRGRAFNMELTAHKTAAHNYAGAWRWLDRQGGDGTVAVHGTPIDFFVYPAMGLHLERRAIYVNVNRQDFRNAADYPGCVPRVDLDPRAWVENLMKQDVRWLLVSRFPQVGFPEEYDWATALPGLFTVRYRDLTNVIFEFTPPAAPANGAPPGSGDRSPAASAPAPGRPPHPPRAAAAALRSGAPRGSAG
jgi:hypothetical protein